MQIKKFPKFALLSESKPQLDKIPESPETRRDELPSQQPITLSQTSLDSQGQFSSQMAAPPQPMYANDRNVLKILIGKGPMEMSGPVLLDKRRRVLWRNLCMIGRHHIECIVEMSMHRNKFYIVALDLYANKFHVVELWLQQA